MTTEFEHHTGQEFQAVCELIRELSQRVDSLERELDNAQEEIRGLIRGLVVDVGQHQDELNAFRVEIDEIGADVACLYQDENS